MSKIEWTDRTWNPVRGCSRVSEGCRNCYAERVAARFSDDERRGPTWRGAWGDGMEDPRAESDFTPAGAFHGYAEQTKAGPRWTGKVELIPEKLDEPLRWKKPAKIFVNSMSDLFHEKLSDEDIDPVFAVMALRGRHTFQVLTKRPERMRSYVSAAYGRVRKLVDGDDGPNAVRTAWWRTLTEQQLSQQHQQWWTNLKEERWPLPNVWLGVSVEDQKTADERIPLLLQTPAAVRFVSYEPALGPVRFDHIAVPGGTFTPYWNALTGFRGHQAGGSTDHPRLDWIIVGGESGPGARPFDIAWARSTVEQCMAAGVAPFVKQLGARPYYIAGQTVMLQPAKVPLTLRDRKGKDPSEWPEDLSVREFPRGA